MKYDLFLRNVFYISSLARFNSERIIPLEKFYDLSVSSGMIFNKVVDLDDIRKFCLANTKPKKTPLEVRKEILFDRVLMIPAGVSSAWAVNYVGERYAPIDTVLFRETGFHVYSLTTVEKILSGLVEFRAGTERLPNEIYKFKNREEYGDLCFIAEPSRVFESKWSNCITLSEDDIVETYMQDLSFSDSLYSAVSDQAEIGPKRSSTLAADEARKVLEFLSKEYAVGVSKSFDFLIKPLIRHHSALDKRTYYIVPFPFVLGSTLQIRLENIIQNSRKLSEADEGVKGRLVEALASFVLPRFPNRNIVKNLRYKIQEEECETDTLLIMEKSIWAIEIKSHPLFRKIPFEIDKLIPTFVDKVREGFKQGKRTLDWISNKNDLLSSLNCDKNVRDMIKGVIVLLDGYLPTILTQNKMVDQVFGADPIYDEIKGPHRVYALTMLDLYVLSVQPDNNNFEDFLLQRTSYPGRMPLIAYEEKDYWAYFNDLGNRKVADENFPRMAENGSIIIYISARFNRKDYLSELHKEKKSKSGN